MEIKILGEMRSEIRESAALAKKANAAQLTLGVSLTHSHTHSLTHSLTHTQELGLYVLTRRLNTSTLVLTLRGCVLRLRGSMQRLHAKLSQGRSVRESSLRWK